MFHFVKKTPSCSLNFIMAWSVLILIIGIAVEKGLGIIASL